MFLKNMFVFKLSGDSYCRDSIYYCHTLTKWCYVLNVYWSLESECGVLFGQVH